MAVENDSKAYDNKSKVIEDKPLEIGCRSNDTKNQSKIIMRASKILDLFTEFSISESSFYTEKEQCIFRHFQLRL